jgi:hypothetical protein
MQKRALRGYSGRELYFMPVLWHQNIEARPGKAHCPKCHTNFFIDDRVECVFGETADLKLPLAGTICPVCGLIQGEESDQCIYCNAKLNSFGSSC